MKKFLDSNFSNLLFTIFIALVVCFVIKTFILETQIVKSSNMSPTLTSGDFVLINKLNKTIKKARRCIKYSPGFSVVGNHLVAPAWLYFIFVF